MLLFGQRCMMLMGMVMIMEISSADLCKCTLQEVADLLLTEGKHCALCKGVVDGQIYSLRVELMLDE